MKGRVANPSPRAALWGREVHPSQKGKEENSFRLPQWFKAKSLFGFLVMPHLLGAPAVSRDPSRARLPCPPRCDCSVWPLVPLQPPQVLPGLRCGCPGTVRTPRAPQTSLGSCKQDLAPGTAFLPMAGTAGRFSPPPPPLLPPCAPGCVTFALAVPKEGGD